jgi:sulfur carrier protein
MKIRLNGAEIETSARTLAELLEELGLPTSTVLVEQNGEAPARSEWPSASLRESDSVEILRVAAGG